MSNENNRRRNGGGFGPHGGMAVSGEKADTKKALGNLFSYAGVYQYFLFTAVILAMTGSILNLIGPGRIKRITEIIQEGLFTGIDKGAVVDIAIFLVVIYGLGFIFSYAQGFIMATISQKITQNMRKDISVKINKVPLKYFDTNSTGDILSRVTNDVDMVGQTLNQSFTTLVSSITLFFGAMFVMFASNWIMAIAAVLSTIAGFAMMIFIISKSQKYFLGQQKELGNIDGHIEEIFTGHNVVKAYNGEEKAIKEFNEMNDRLFTFAWKSQFLSGVMMPMMMFIGNFAYVVVCIVGAVLAVNDVVTVGDIVAFMIYIRLFTQPLQNISQAATSLQSMSAALERVFGFLEEDEMEDESYKMQALIVEDVVKGNISFDHVKFGYNEDRLIIKDFTLDVKAGQKVAIVGPTGAGKTTLVNLLMRFYEINSGSIKVEGVDTSKITREVVHDMFAMVLQDTWIFEGTIRENILYNKSHITDSELDDITKAAGIYDFIRQQPDGYDTVLGDKVSLSAGQKQLITIARAMAEDSPMLILDEATSSVDTRTEIKIQEAMDKLTHGRTSFIIAHRLSTIKNADIILVMKDGDIIESGSHDVLMAEKGFYSELYNSQFETA